MVKKPPIGAHYGLRDWIAQRATAVVMVVAILILAIALFVIRPDDYNSWRAFIDMEWVRVLLFCTVLATVWHGFIGARDIYMDYLKHDGIRLLKTTGMVVYLLACVVWAARILL
ncbi:MAG: succinate dehydrogenase, hydrophobic membrane anchor protein [Gammaproteobacteria bacterium WSBS_2016_MAG_OTU1]